MVTAALFTTAKTRKQPKCPLTDECTDTAQERPLSCKEEWKNAICSNTEGPREKTKWTLWRHYTRDRNRTKNERSKAIHFFSWCLQPSGISGLLSQLPRLPPPCFNHHLARFYIFSSFYLSPQVHPPQACNHFVILLWGLSSLSACVWNWGSPKWLHHYKYIC